MDSRLITMADVIWPIFVFIFWVLLAFVHRITYESWSGKRWSYAPNFSMMWITAALICVWAVGLIVTDAIPVFAAWAIIILHLLFGVFMLRWLIRRWR